MIPSAAISNVGTNLVVFFLIVLAYLALRRWNNSVKVRDYDNSDVE